MDPAVRVRFAPSPTGHLHVGNARTALFNWLFARGSRGTFILRIEDTDVERSTTSSESMIYEDLAWLGLDWDEGPLKGGPCGPYRQSERKAAYAAAAKGLMERGGAYRCFCTEEALDAERESQRDAGLAPRYGGRCRTLPEDEASRRAASEPHALRFRVPETGSVIVEDLIRGRVEFPAGQIGDPVIVRAGGTPTYNFAVVVDDTDMRITHVIRGEDHLSNTPRQILIYQALGATPPRFAHLSLVMGEDGGPLSKRHGASSIADFRDRGFLPEALVNYLALLGWAHPEGREVLRLEEIVSAFSLRRVGHSAAMFDMKKLSWLNAHYLRAKTPGQLAGACRGRLVAAGFMHERPVDGPCEEWIGRALHVYSGQMETLADAVPATGSLFRFEEHISGSPSAAKAIDALAAEKTALDVVSRFAEKVEARQPPLLAGRELFREVAVEVGRELGLKGRALYHPIRVAVTGVDEGPELDRVVPLIDEGSLLDMPVRILPCAERARAVARRLGA